MKKNKKQKRYGLIDLLYDYQNTKYIDKNWEQTKNMIYYGLLYNLFRNDNNKNDK